MKMLTLIQSMHIFNTKPVPLNVCYRNLGCMVSK